MYITYQFDSVRGGKNNMKITRRGIHYPSPEFKKWSQEIIWQLRLHKSHPTINQDNLFYTFYFCPRTKRRKDVPAILDAIFHCLEKAQIVSDDSVIKNILFYTFNDRQIKNELTLIISESPIHLMPEYWRGKK